MDRVLPVLLLLLLFLALVALMVLGWRRRGARQSDIGGPGPDESLEALDGGVAAGPFEAVYVSTVIAGEPLERVVAHGLGARSRARVSVGVRGSWRIEREGAPSFTIRGDRVRDVTTAYGMVGKSIGPGGLLIVRWGPGGDAMVGLDTGFRMADRAEHNLLLHWKDNL